MHFFNDNNNSVKIIIKREIKYLIIYITCRSFEFVFNERWEKRDTEWTKQRKANREKGLIKSNVLLPKYIEGSKECDCRRIASFRNYPEPFATDCRLIAQVRNIPGDRGSFLRASVSLFFSLCCFFWNLLCPERSNFPWTGHEQYAPHGTIVSPDLSPTCAFFRIVHPTENHRQCGTFAR